MVSNDQDTQAAALGGPMAYIREIRPHQWVKNLLVFVPMLAAHRLDMATLQNSVMAFVAFSMMASSAYVLNDMLDLEADRAHPRKRLRPLASGAVPENHGTILAVVLFLVGLLVAALTSWLVTLAAFSYFAITVVYSLALKRYAVWDICVLAGLYAVRLIAGAAAAGVNLSIWLLAFSTFLFFALAAVKRQAEMVDGMKRGKVEVAGRGYTVEDLPLMSQMGISAGYVAVLVLALYIHSPHVAHLYENRFMLWGTCPAVFFWITHMVMAAHRGVMHDDPIVFAFSDRTSQLCGLVVIFCVAAASASPLYQNA